MTELADINTADKLYLTRICFSIHYETFGKYANEFITNYI